MTMRRLLLLLPSLFLILLVARPAAADGPIVYVVQPGDTLSGIAERYQTTPDAIARLNNLEDRDILQPGQKLAMLASGPGEIRAADSDAAPVGPRRDAQPQPVHLVVAGETLSSIAAQYDTSVDELVSLNGLPSASLISIGQLLRLPSPPPPASDTAVAALPVGRTADYTVEAGDTLSDIAFRYGLDARTVAVVNNLPADSWLWPGQKLQLPVEWQVKDAPKPALRKRIEVDVSDQRAYAWEGNVMRYKFVVSTGLPGYNTRRGRFTIQSKIPVAVSTGLNLDMPYWMGIYYAGSTENGFHALPINRTTKVKLWGGFIGRPISYGCIVLRDSDAAVLYNWAEMGTLVDIHD